MVDNIGNSTGHPGVWGLWGEDQRCRRRDALQAGGRRSRGVLKERGTPENLLLGGINFTLSNLNVFPYLLCQQGGSLREKHHLESKVRGAFLHFSNNCPFKLLLWKNGEKKTNISPFPATHTYIKLTLVSFFFNFFLPLSLK